jgi:hypothetical protein
MMMRFDNIVSLPSGNTARNFRVHDIGNGRVRIQYVYTDRRRAHQVSRHFTAEFLNGRLQSITARSARGGRVESFSTSIIIDVLLEMLAEVNRANEALSNFRKDVAEMRAAETTETPEEQDSVAVADGTALMDTLKMVGGMVMINIIVTLVTLGIVWYNL